MHTLITGGAGFLGSHLTERLLADGDQVTVLDDLSAGEIGNLGEAFAHPAFQFVQGSAGDPDVVLPLVQTVDRVLHLAAPVGPRRIIEDGVGTIEGAFRSVQTVLQASAKFRKPVFYASSSEVYGLSDRLPYREDDVLLLGGTGRARFSYACGKALGEWLAFAYHREQGLPVCVLRLFNIVGPRQSARHGLVLATFVEQALTGKPLSIHGDGRQRRCFLHVADAVVAIVSLMRAPDALGQAVNIGRAEESSVLFLAERVRALVAPVPVEYVPLQDAHAVGYEPMQRRVPDLTRLWTLTGFCAKRDLDAMIQDTATARVALTLSAAT